MRTLAPLGRATGTLLLTAFLVVALAIAVQGAFQTRASIADTFSRQSSIQAAQLALEELLRLQIVEENALRGYSLTHDSFYVDQYLTAASAYDSRITSIRAALQPVHLVRIAQLLTEYVRIQSQWRDEIATPLLRHPNDRLAVLDKRNKVFADYETRIVAAIRSELAAANETFARSTQEQLERTAYVRAFWLLLFGLLAILFNGYRTRLYRELEEERTTTETLQRAFASESVPLPNCEVGTAYRSASSHVAVGGDVFDVYRLPGSLALLLIADVSGKGVDAAVLTAFIKFTMRAIALRLRDPGAILAEFNTAFEQGVQDPYLFVSMFVGVLDTRTLCLHYASAGHDSAFVRRSDSVQQLDVTGPVLGVMEEPFGSKTIDLRPGDALILATDGLTEARDRAGNLLGEAGAMRLIERSPRRAQALADDLVNRVRSIVGNRLRDDLAILVVRVDETAGSDA
ncbi:MAG: SpoIIE family protein phosphatase [Candidatus Tumulicola sp.]